MKPFDKAAALRGEPVVTRDGRPVTNLVEFPVANEEYTLYGVIDNTVEDWTATGAYYASTKSNSVPDSCRDLFMAPSTVKAYIAVGKYGDGPNHPELFATHGWSSAEEATKSYTAVVGRAPVKVIEVEVAL